MTKYKVNLLLEVFVTGYRYHHFDTVYHLMKQSNPLWTGCMNYTVGNTDAEFDLGADTFFKLAGIERIRNDILSER